MCKTLDVTDFKEHVARTIDNLLFASDQHFLLAWDSKSQNEILNLLFAPTKEFDRVLSVWADVSSADSQYRNARYQAGLLEREIETLLAAQPESADSTEAKYKILVASQLAAEQRRDAVLAAEGVEEAKLSALDAQVQDAEASFADVASALSTQDPVDLDAQIATFAFTTPSVESTYWALKSVADARGKTRCVCCARFPGRDTPHLVHIRSSFDQEQCPVCGIGLQATTTSSEVNTEEDGKQALLRQQTSELAVQLQDAVATREAARSRLLALKAARLSAEDETHRVREEVWNFRTLHQSLGGTDIDKKKGALKQLQEQEQAAKARRDRLVTQFESIQRGLRGKLESLLTDLASDFGNYCGLFLDET